MMFLLLIIIGCSIVLLYWINRSRASHPSLPPGPPGDPLIGHLLKIPTEASEDLFYEWGKIYGDVIYLHVLGRSIVVLNSVEAATDLLDRRSANYSDRPRFEVFKLMGWNRVITFTGYGKRFQKHRRFMQQHMNKNAVADYQSVQTREARVLLQKALSDNLDWNKQLQFFSTAIILRITYGYQISSDDDPFLALTEGVSHALSNSGTPASTPVDLFPFLGYLPAWFPGSFYGGFARDHKHAVETLHKFGYENLKKEMAEGRAKACFLTREIETLESDGPIKHDDILDLQGAGATIFAAGAETTYTTLSWFTLTMTLFPELQDRAQKEIDTVIGTERLPEFADRPLLPFLECVLQETLRWRGALPLGVPHRSLEDDIYRGMFIPKGSLVIANSRGMALDERTYKNPHVFNPTRYLPKPEGDDEPFPNGPFGFGRRICPGRYLADASLWIAMAHILATCRISKAVGEDGKEITPEVSFTSGLTSQPKSFSCRIEPRNEATKTLILNADTWDSS